MLSLFCFLKYNLLLKESLEFIQNASNKTSNNKTVAATHHAPTFVNYPEKYARGKISEAFASNLTEFIEDNSIAFWIYGHHPIVMIFR